MWPKQIPPRAAECKHGQVRLGASAAQRPMAGSEPGPPWAIPAHLIIVCQPMHRPCCSECQKPFEWPRRRAAAAFRGRAGRILRRCGPRRFPRGAGGGPPRGQDEALGARTRTRKTVRLVRRGGEGKKDRSRVRIRTQAQEDASAAALLWPARRLLPDAGSDEACGLLSKRVSDMRLQGAISGRRSSAPLRCGVPSLSLGGAPQAGISGARRTSGPWKDHLPLRPRSRGGIVPEEVRRPSLYRRPAAGARGRGPEPGVARSGRPGRRHGRSQPCA